MAVETYKTEGTVSEGHELTIGGLPFAPGERVEVIVRVSNRPMPSAGRYPLRGTVYRYEDPTDPVATEDWETAA